MSGRVMEDPVYTIMSGFVDRCEWIYWDTVFASADSFPLSVTAFKLARGMFDPIIGRDRTLHDTNMITRGVECGFGVTRSLILEELGIYFPLWLSDDQISVLLSNCSLVLFIAEKVYCESRLDFREGTNPGQDVVNMPEEVFHAPEFSGRMVRIRAKDKFARVIPPLMPFSFELKFSSQPVFHFEGVQPIMIPTMAGLCDRAVQ